MEEEKHASHPKRSMPLRLPNSSHASKWEANKNGFSGVWDSKE